jgi:transposase
MARPGKYPNELVERGIRLVFGSGFPSSHVARDLGLPPETLRKRVRQAEVDTGRRQGLGSEERRRSRSSARRSPSCGARMRSSARRDCFSLASSIQTERDEPVYRGAPGPFRGRADLPDPLGVSASAYYHRASGRRSERAVEDDRLASVTERLHETNYGAYGYRRVWKALTRAGERVGRDRTRRLMTQRASTAPSGAGSRGARPAPTPRRPGDRTSSSGSSR